MQLRLHAFEPASRANGPGLRAAIWFQGCSIGCPGCFNRETHDPCGGSLADTEELAGRIFRGSQGIEGASISGGEPFEQPQALLDLVRRIRSAGLGVLLFSGYTIEKIRLMPLGPRILSQVDVLIAGPYVQSQHRACGLLGSINQRIHFLTSRYTPSDFAAIPGGEIVLHKDGSVTLSGISPPQKF